MSPTSAESMFLHQHEYVLYNHVSYYRYIAYRLRWSFARITLLSNCQDAVLSTLLPFMPSRQTKEAGTEKGNVKDMHVSVTLFLL